MLNVAISVSQVSRQALNVGPLAFRREVWHYKDVSEGVTSRLLASCNGSQTLVFAQGPVRTLHSSEVRYFAAILATIGKWRPR
jgi:hypothetical protein